MVRKYTQHSHAKSHVYPQAYDYAGSWLSFADNQANLYGGTRTGVNTDDAVKFFTSHGATASKITMGEYLSLSMYGGALTYCQASLSMAVPSRTPLALASLIAE